jgi:hypothetical protein
MEILIIVLVAVALGYAIYAYNNRTTDLNEDGKVDAKDVKGLVEMMAAKVDLNQDGKIDAKDAKTAVKKAAKSVKKAGTTAKATVKKATTAVSKKRQFKPKAK